MKPRLGFVGVGWIGRNRLEAIAASGAAEIVAIADISPELVRQALPIAPDALCLASMEEMYDLDLDGIVIATPSAVHAEQAIAALERGGLAVFCQKPLGRDADEVRRIVDTARRANRLLEVDLSYRHVEGVQKIRELVRAGQLGKIFAADLVFHNAYGPDKAWFYDPKLSGGGCVMDLGIHLVDLALWILDTSVVEVTAQVFANGEPLPIDSKFPEDYAVARLTLDCGAVANIACSWRLHAGRDAMIEATFFGTRGGVAMRNVNGSFFDFITERFRGTKSEIIAQPPEAWGGRAAVGWVKSLARSNAFNPEIERQIEIAQTLDAIYGAELVAARRSKSLFSIPR